MTPPTSDAATERHRTSSAATSSRLIIRDDLAFRLTSSVGTVAAGNRHIVLVHGVGMSGRTFAPLGRVLARSHSVHTLDLPGFGGQPRPDRDVPIEVMARALGHVLDAARVQTPVLVGHSMGSQWVLELALQRPADCAGVVLIGPVVDDARRNHRAQLVALAVDTIRETPAANIRVLIDAARCSHAWYTAQTQHMMRYPTEERVTRLGVPALMLRGGRDPISGATWCRRLRDAAPNGRLVEVPRIAHHVQFTKPATVAAAIDAFTAATISPANP